MAVPLSFIAVNDPGKGIVVLPHAFLPPTYGMAHSHRLIMSSHGIFHFKNTESKTSPVVQIEYTRSEWATGHVWPSHIGEFATVVKDMLNSKDRSGWEFYVYEEKPHWFLSKEKYIKDLCDELIAKMRFAKYRPPGIFIPSPELFPIEPKYVWTCEKQACRLVGWSWPADAGRLTLHHFAFPNPARCLVELYKHPTNKEDWMATYWNKFTGAYFIEMGPGVMETAQPGGHFSVMLDTVLHGPGEPPEPIKVSRM